MASGPPRFVTWRLFDANGQLVPGYTEHMPLTYASERNRWECTCAVGDLITGATYTAMVYYTYTCDTPIEFLKASGTASVVGYVRDDDGGPLENALVRLFRVQDYYPPPGPPLYQTCTGADGYYEFIDIDADAYIGSALFEGLRPGVQVIYALSDQIQTVDFKLYTDAVEEFGHMLDRLRAGCGDALDDLGDALEDTVADDRDLADGSEEWLALDILDIAGSIILRLGYGSAMETVSVMAGPTFAASLIEVWGTPLRVTAEAIIITQYELLLTDVCG